jgi:opacity protein-like surface antigen
MRLISLATAAALVATPAAAADANFLDGAFEGGYTCGQGMTFLRLTLDGDTDGYIRGRFFFSSVSWQGGSNLSVPDGEFTVTGRLNDQGQIVLQGERWIQQPANYGMVNLAGLVRRQSDGALVLEGNVGGAPGCTTFQVGRK